MSKPVETVEKPEKRVELNQPLVVQHTANSVSQLIVDPPANFRALSRAGQQIHNLVLTYLGTAPGSHHRRLQRTPRRIEEFVL
jgi:hypothetical protein